MLSLVLAACRSGGNTSAGGSTVDRVGAPARPGDAKNVADASIATLLGPLRERLLARAERDDTGGDDAGEGWDEAVNLALAVRARIELLRLGAVAEPRRVAIRRRAQADARRLIEYEARGPRGQRQCSAACQQGRGWGTSKPIRMAALAADGGVIDAYSTGVVLGAVAEVVDDGLRQADAGAARALYDSAIAVADDWITERLFLGPGGHPSFDKFVSRSPDIRHYTVFNTDALLARALLVLADSARQLDDPQRALRYEQTAGGVAASLRRWILEPVTRAPLNARAAAWRYGLQSKAGGLVEAQRVEDTNHASFTLDFIALAIERRLGPAPGQPPVFERADLDRLGSLLSGGAFPRGSDGLPLYRVFIDSAEVERGRRGKSTVSAFAPTPDRDRSYEVVSWWKELGGDRRSLDLGLSIRTSWGWAQAVAHDEPSLAALGRYLTLAARDPAQQNARNLFLAQAVWARVAER